MRKSVISLGSGSEQRHLGAEYAHYLPHVRSLPALCVMPLSTKAWRLKSRSSQPSACARERCRMILSAALAVAVIIMCHTGRVRADVGVTCDQCSKLNTGQSLSALPGIE
ncbi:hypothetical protein RRG08_053049 [Elysia crispata]|uniref:Uncharacterized protein n=1 Tax=Elysia crispata TaxID=231223 RepID=A0AAE1CLB0_9GAST|nr:hypothetical protein RRG08_053049 [Elysia crispata]